MLIAEKKTKYTVDDYLLLEEGAPFQLIENDLVMSPASSLLHQLILAEFYDVLKLYVKQNFFGGLVVLSPIDIYFDEGNVCQPDIVYISKERKEQVINNGRIEGAPNLVVEVLSPSNAYYDLRQKKNLYERYGVQEYVIIDPIEQSIELYALDNGTYILKQKALKAQTLHSVILPGLSFDLQKIFGQ